MAKHGVGKKRRFGGLLVLAVAAVAGVVSLVMVSGPWKEAEAQSQTQPMELLGHWLGMKLASADSSRAAELGVPPTVNGVVVAEVSPQQDSRALQAGLAPGDVVMRVDGTSVGSLKELYTLTTELDVARPVTVDILRGGKPMTAQLPPPPELAGMQVNGIQNGVAPPYGGSFRVRTPGLGPNCAFAVNGQVQPRLGLRGGGLGTGANCRLYPSGAR